ncbi:MAG: hypothetical protein WCO66_01020 [Candidatus Absconditabacteria bacterium]|jgi:hypothetical protein
METEIMLIQERLVELLLDIAPEERTTLYQETELRISKNSPLDRLFSAQIQYLETLGYPAEILAKLYSYREQVMDAIAVGGVADGNISFIPVIPEKTLSFRKQASLISGDSGLEHRMDCASQGHYLLYSVGCNGAYTPTFSDQPYYIIDVNIGEELVDKDVKIEGYRNVNHQELMAIATWTDVTKQYNICGMASYWDNTEWAVIEWQDKGKFGSFPFCHWGSPNKDTHVLLCRQRIIQ